MVPCTRIRDVSRSEFLNVTGSPDVAFVALALGKKVRDCLIDVKRKDFRILMPNCARVQHSGMLRVGWGRWSPLSVQCMDDKIIFEIFFHLVYTVPRLGLRGKARFLGRLVATSTWSSIAAFVLPCLRQV